MKTLTLLAFLALLTPAVAETAAPAKVRFKGKIGAPTTTTVTATRGDKEGSLRFVAIAPGNEGITAKGKPRLWWFQSEDTGPREFEFVLSRLDGTPAVLLRRVIAPAMKKGFNFVDFNNKGFNKEGVTLESGGVYQWTIRLVAEKSAPQVFCRMKVALADPAVEKTDLQSLAEAGNWYELFDAVSIAAATDPQMATTRTELLAQIGLAESTR